MIRSSRRIVASVFALLSLAGLVSCGRPPLIGGRAYPPDFDNAGYPRAMVAWAVGGTGPGTLQLIDVEHDTVNNKEDTVHSYVINGYHGVNPLTIQNFPGAQIAYVFADGGTPPSSAANFQPANTATDTVATALAGITPGTTSAYVSSDFAYIYAANPTLTHSTVGYVTVVRATDGGTALIPQPGVNKLAVSPGAQTGSSTVLMFTINANNDSNNVYQLVGIGQNSIYDCTQQVVPGIPFDKPINALYSSDGTSAFILNCGLECGGTQASVSVARTADLAAGAQAAYEQQTGCNIVPGYMPAPLSVTVQNIPVAGGATAALQLGTTLFVAGQEYVSGTAYGVLTAIDLNSVAVAQTTLIGPGSHFRMRVGDNNTLWIAANGICQAGYATAGGGLGGCVTMVPLAANGPGFSIVNPVPMANLLPVACQQTSGTAPNSPCVEPAQGATGGIAPIIGYSKTYTVEGGAVYIYSTVDGSAISNLFVQVPGYAKDIAFIDGTTNTAP